MKSVHSSLIEKIDKDLSEVFEKYGTDTKAALMPVLQEINYKYGNLSEYMIMRIAEAFDMSATEIYGTATFYHFLRTKSVGTYVISLCKTVSCDMKGKDRIVKVLENELGVKIGQTTADGKFTLEYTSCIGMCDQSPAMLINGKVYSSLTPEKVVDILKEYRYANRI
jgi:NADH:ubiquinone oxidoreductase subunit E